jgi:hypothetical protein
MAYTFTDGEVATKAKLDAILPGLLSQAGLVKVTPVANTPTSVHIDFPTPFLTPPHVVATAYTTVIGSSVQGVSVASITTTGFDLYVYRVNTVNTTVAWQAWVAPVAFTTGKPAYARILNQAAGSLQVQSGAVTITPVANSPTSAAVTFSPAFLATPLVLVAPMVTVPGTAVKGTAVTEASTTGFKAWVYRTSATATTLHWIALGRF